MASVSGTNATLYASNDPVNMIPRGEGSASECVAIDTYTSTAITSGSDITLFAPLPDGAYVTGIDVYHAALGSSTTIAIGDGSDADRFLAATSTSSAGVLRANLDINTSVEGKQIVLTTGGATLTASRLITVIVRYVLK